jgi:hypothetical protein
MFRIPYSLAFSSSWTTLACAPTLVNYGAPPPLSSSYFPAPPLDARVPTWRRAREHCVMKSSSPPLPLRAKGDGRQRAGILARWRRSCRCRRPAMLLERISHGVASTAAVRARHRRCSTQNSRVTGAAPRPLIRLNQQAGLLLTLCVRLGALTLRVTLREPDSTVSSTAERERDESNVIWIISKWNEVDVTSAASAEQTPIVVVGGDVSTSTCMQTLPKTAPPPTNNMIEQRTFINKPFQTVNVFNIEYILKIIRKNEILFSG